MADEPTLITGGPGGAFKKPEPPSLVDKLVFSIPAIILSLLIAIGASYFIAKSADDETRNQLAAAKTQLQDDNKKLGTRVSEAEQARQELQKTVVDLNGKVKTLETEKDEIKKNVETAAKNFDDFSKSLSSFAEETKKLDQSQSADLRKHEDNINTLETKIKYIDEKLRKIDELAQDVNGLKTDTG